MNDGREELRSRVRHGEPTPGSHALVLRGGPDSASLLRAHATRFNRLFVLDGQPVFGISVFVASDRSGTLSSSNILSTRLRSYRAVYRTSLGTFTDAGFILLPTFASPHFTVMLTGVADADELLSLLGEQQLNPYNPSMEEP